MDAILASPKRQTSILLVSKPPKNRGFETGEMRLISLVLPTRNSGAPELLTHPYPVSLCHLLPSLILLLYLKETSLAEPHNAWLVIFLILSTPMSYDVATL
jgi:hypothetical protein